MDKKICAILLSGKDQEKCFWKNYSKVSAGYSYDMVLVHRDFLGFPDKIPENKDGKTFLENKIVNGEDIPHRAFGAYRHYFNKYKDQYDYFIFISDDVVLKRNNWVKSIIDSLNRHEKIGFGSSQIFNGSIGYPHSSHLRAPFWFAKTEVLKKINWEFDNDHDGEMKIGNQCTQAGYVGIQVGNKVNLAYDVFEPNHITQILEKQYFPESWPYGVHDDFFRLDEVSKKEQVISPYPHIGIQSIESIQPYDMLIFEPSRSIVNQRRVNL